MMHIREDEIQKIGIDRFVSTSGLWLCVLAERFEPTSPGMKGYYIVVATADTRRVRKVVCIGHEPGAAYVLWEAWKQKFTAPAQFQESDIPTGLDFEFKPSWPIINEEDRQMSLKLRPMGARMFVREITPVDEVTARAEAAGLVAVVAEENKPRPTMGIIIALGDDPFLVDRGFKIGSIVMFSKHSGSTFSEAGQQYRSLDHHEIIGMRDAEKGIEDLLPPPPNALEKVMAIANESPELREDASVNSLRKDHAS